MRTLRAALLTAALAVPLAFVAARAKAAEPVAPGEVLYNAAGAPVAIVLPSPVVEAPMFAFPAGIEKLFAEQDAMLRQAMDQMDALAAAPVPDRTIEAALGKLPHDGSVARVVVASVSDGHGICSRTIIWHSTANGSPVVNVRQTGDACGAVPSRAGSTLVPAARPAPAVPAPKVVRAAYWHPAAPAHRAVAKD